MTSRTVALLVALALVAACGDVTRPRASLSTFSDSASAYALNGAPAGAPTAFYAFGERMVHADPSFLFDIAFDLDANNKIVLLPARTVANGLAAPHSVGLQVVTTNFD